MSYRTKILNLEEENLLSKWRMYEKTRRSLARVKNAQERSIARMGKDGREVDMVYIRSHHIRFPGLPQNARKVNKRRLHKRNRRMNTPAENYYKGSYSYSTVLWMMT